MIRGILLAGLIVLVPLSASAQQTDAKALAQDILDRGAKQFDTKDAHAIAITFPSGCRRIHP